MNEIKEFQEVMEDKENIVNSGHWFVRTPQYKAMIASIDKPEAAIDKADVCKHGNILVVSLWRSWAVKCQDCYLVWEDAQYVKQVRTEEEWKIVEEKKQTLKEIAENKYSFFKHLHRQPSAHEWFLCLSDYLEQQDKKEEKL